MLVAAPWTYSPAPLQIPHPPLTASPGGLNLALTVARSQPRKRRRPWWHYNRHEVAGVLLIVGFAALLYWLAR